MYCENCGAKIDRDSNFCEFCGTKVENDTTQTEEIIDKKPKKNTQETKILFALLLCAIFGFIFIQELKYFNSPENAMQNFLKDWKNKNYDSILTSLNIEKNDFTNPELFEKIFAENEEFKIIDYQVSHCEYEEDEKIATCKVNYQTAKNGIYHEKKYKLYRSSSNRLWIFANWTIENQDFTILENWNLYLPKDSVGKIYNLELKDYRNTECDKNGYDCYSIPNIFKGTYDLNIILNTGMSLDSKINIQRPEYTYQFSIQDISEDFKEELNKVGKNIIETLYQGIALASSWESLKSDYEISALKDTYENLKKEISKTTNLTDFQVADLAVIQVKINEEGNLYITYQMTYEYQLKYTKDEKTQTHKGKSNDTFYITIKNADLKEIEAVESLVTYFSKKY